MKKYKTEEEFLKSYDSSIYEKLSMTSDILIISISNEESDNYRKNKKKRMSILLIKREDYPYKDKWCLPGGFLNPKDETLEECARRVLKDETNLSDIYLEQLYTFDSIARDPRLRVISTAYIALIDKNMLTEKVKNASWFDIIKRKETKDSIELVLSNKEEEICINVTKTLKNKKTNDYLFTLNSNNSLAFDHALVVIKGLERITNKINYTDIVFNLMPKYFTLKDLQQVYEIILNKKLLDPAFRRIIKNKVEKTNKRKLGEGHRPSYLYKYKNNE